MTWWKERPMRMVQTNLREIDLPLDPEQYARGLADFGADVALFNLGGIVANYPTQLDYHFRNPRLDLSSDLMAVSADPMADVIEQLHRRGIRFIGRFDFSKVNESIAALHPEWLYVSLKGETLSYNGQVSACVNGAYQQECSLEILAEALARYRLDGVFFNMFGFQTHDYSGNYHGPCQCASCQRRFQEYAGAPVPTQDDRSDPVYQLYTRFCQDTSRQQIQKIRDFIKTRGEIAVSTWSDVGVDIFRSESNSGIRRPQPEFVYDASLNVRRVHASFPGTVASNTAVHFIDFPYRHAGVAPALTQRRLAQDFIYGGWLDYYVIGRLDQQHDRRCQEGVRSLFHLHRQAVDWLERAGFLPLVSLADVCLVEPDRSRPGSSLDELKGLICLLSEAHRLYDVVAENSLVSEQALKPLEAYALVVVPDMPFIAPELAEKLAAYARGGGTLLLTGLSETLEGAGLLKLCGVSSFTSQEPVPGAYLAVQEREREIFTELDEVDWIPLDTPWLRCVPAAGARAYLRQVPVGMYGPPEKCYYTEISEHPGLLVQACGKGTAAVLPWKTGGQYLAFPTHAVSGLWESVLNVLEVRRSLRVEAPAVIEVSAFVRKDSGGMLAGLANLSGQNWRAVHEPLPLADLRLRIPERLGGDQAESLRLGKLASERAANGDLVIDIPRLELLDLVRIS
jgi:hypothetical protein